ncbi:fibronectin type III domain-containing protein [Candidatus Kaiserbacteria bacterium]|nr:MAG: fibronectin type III domain-containing protein [Candidatus Kaiserbacteria bacterium]
MKNFLIVSTFFVAILSCGFVGAPQTAEAACSWNSYYNPNGACVSSSEQNENRYEYRNNWEWNRSYRGDNNTEYLRAQIHQLMMILASYQQHRYSSSDSDNNNDSDVDVRTQSATDVDENSATLRAIVDMNNEDEAELYFEYGRSSGNLSLKTSRENLDDNDDGDTIEVEVDDLSEDTRYYYRAVAVDEDGDRDYGTTNNFTTDGDRDDNNNDDDEPVVTTRSATDIDDESAELRGTVDMNDFDNGRAFFVYGEDEDAVSDVEDDFDSYDDVDEDGDDLQKVLVDSDVDDFDELSEDISGLNDNTDIFFALCVEYEDEDDDSTLSCGAVREFTTE